jgi:hypothetical protein
MLTFSCEPTGDESRKCTQATHTEAVHEQAVRGELWGVIRALQSNKDMYFPSSLQLPTYIYSTTEALIGSWLGRYMKKDSP